MGIPEWKKEYGKNMSKRTRFPLGKNDDLNLVVHKCPNEGNYNRQNSSSLAFGQSTTFLNGRLDSGQSEGSC